MKVKDIIEKLNLQIFSGNENLDRIVNGGYCSDLLSDVMGNAAEGDVWITLQFHKNIIAVAALKDVTAIIIINGKKPGDDVIESSQQEGIPVLGTSLSAFETAGLLYQLLQKK